jgi:hypothetical protein
LQWYISELRGAGDLRFYAAVQAYGTLVLLLMLFLPARYTRTSDLVVIVGWYLFAKLLETFDKPIFAFGHIVRGHTLKHLAAVIAGWLILRMVMIRKPITVGYSRVLEISFVSHMNIICVKALLGTCSSLFLTHLHEAPF